MIGFTLLYIQNNWNTADLNVFVSNYEKAWRWTGCKSKREWNEETHKKKHMYILNTIQYNYLLFYIFLHVRLWSVCSSSNNNWPMKKIEDAPPIQSLFKYILFCRMITVCLCIVCAFFLFQMNVHSFWIFINVVLLRFCLKF